MGKSASSPEHLSFRTQSRKRVQSPLFSLPLRHPFFKSNHQQVLSGPLPKCFLNSLASLLLYSLPTASLWSQSFPSGSIVVAFLVPSHHLSSFLVTTIFCPARTPSAFVANKKDPGIRKW